MLTRTRPETCASDLLLDRWIGGELSQEEERAAREHVAGCEACRVRQQEIAAERALFLREIPSWSQAGPKAPRRLGALKAGLGVFAVAAVTMLALSRFHASDPVQGEVRSKGGKSLGFYIARGEVSERGGPDELVAPGERLQFYYSTQSAGYLAVLSVDGAQQVSTYFPTGGAAVLVEPGQEVLLPHSVVLDGTLGEERIFGLFCARPVALGPIVQALSRVPDAPPVVEGCDVQQLRYRKRAKP